MESAKDVTRGPVEKVPDWCVTLLGLDRHNGEGRGVEGAERIADAQSLPQTLQTPVSSKPRSEFPQSVAQLLKHVTGFAQVDSEADGGTGWCPHYFALAQSRNTSVPSYYSLHLESKFRIFQPPYRCTPLT